MPQYPYRPELKQPKTLGGLDLGNPALAPKGGMVVQNLRRTARAWAPPGGVTVRILSICSADGTAVECFVVEPETEKPLPGMLYCHGGGFFLPLEVPALELAAVYARKLGVRVFLPDYRESAGAMVEWAWCQRTGKYCALYSDMKGGGIG